MKIQVVYHPEPDEARTYQYGVEAGTVGIKVTTPEGQFGNWDFLPEPHAERDVFLLLAELALQLAGGEK
jgi:hypothetical protein